MHVYRWHNFRAMENNRGHPVRCSGTLSELAPKIVLPCARQPVSVARPSNKPQQLPL